MSAIPMKMYKSTSVSSFHDNTKRRIGIFGGSFDPPTLVHAVTASEILNFEWVNEIWFVPCGERDDRFLSNGNLRIEMLNAMLDNYFWCNRDRVKVLDTEVKNGPIMDTYDLMEQLEDENQDCELYFIMGSELLQSYYSWDKGQLLREKYKFIVVSRDSEDFESETCLLPNKGTYLDFNFRFKLQWIDVIERIQQNFDKLSLGVEGIVDKDVVKIIKRESLYF